MSNAFFNNINLKYAIEIFSQHVCLSVISNSYNLTEKINAKTKAELKQAPLCR